MKRFASYYAALAVLFVVVGQADAIIVDADWWSNQTSSAGVWDPTGPNGPERLRLVGGVTTGFIEGTVLLPANQLWQIDATIWTDSQFNLPTEYVDIFIDNNFEQRFFNTPLSTIYAFEHLLTGNQFTYRFEFSSPSTNSGSHLIVGRGTVSAIPEPSTWLFAILGWVSLLVWRRRTTSS